VYILSYYEDNASIIGQLMSELKMCVFVAIAGNYKICGKYTVR